MAIQKVKKADRRHKKAAEKVEVSSDIEERRRQFRHAASGKAAASVPAIPQRRAISKRTLIMLIGILVIISGLGAAAWGYSWMQSPDKIVMDALSNASKASSTSYKGEISLLGSPEPQIIFNGAFSEGKSRLEAKVGMPAGIELSELNVSSIVTKDNYYLKLDEASRLISETAPPALKDSFAPHLPLIREKVDGKWLRVNPNDIDMYQPITHVSRCVASVFRIVTTGDASAQSVVTGLYAQYPFLNVTDSSRPGDTTGKYALRVDTAKYDAFKERLYRSSFYAALAACNQQEHDIKSDDLKSLTIELTIDKVKRVITELTIDQNTSFSTKLTVTPVFNEAVSVQEPTQVVRVSDIQAEAFRNSVKDLLERIQ